MGFDGFMPGVNVAWKLSAIHKFLPSIIPHLAQIHWIKEAGTKVLASISACQTSWELLDIFFLINPARPIEATSKICGKNDEVAGLPAFKDGQEE